MSGLNWSRVRRNARNTAAANPKGGGPVPLRGGSHVKPGKVRRLKDMSESERTALVASIHPPGKSHNFELLGAFSATRYRKAKAKPDMPSLVHCIAAVCDWLDSEP